jgi:subtilisin family serine protease
VFRPRIILPQSLVNTCSAGELELLILHELAHVVRLDLLINWVQVAVQVIYWFNPMVWFVNREIRREREQACDDRVLAVTGFMRREYASSLVKALEMSTPRAPLLFGTVGVIEPWDSLKTRLQRIMDPKRRITPRLTMGAIVILAALAMVLLPLHPSAESDQSAVAIDQRDKQCDINSKVARLSIDDATLEDVISVFGEAEEYVWGSQTFTEDSLPSQYCVAYPGRFLVVMNGGRVEELRFHEPGFVLDGKIQVGSALQDVLDTVGTPAEVVEGRNAWQPGILYKDIDGKAGYCYYHSANKRVRFFFTDNRVSALYVTRSDFGKQTSTAAPPKVATLGSVNEFDDVRSKDLSGLDLSQRAGLISRLTFNRETVWPERGKMPPGPSPAEILDAARNPGLGVRDLHRQGITGKGVNVAIVDQPLLGDHPEYHGKIAAYHDVGCDGPPSSMHGPAVASLLVGENCGTAPGARVYYVAAPSWTKDASYQAKALDWIVETNAALPDGQQIRVVSVSAAPSGPSSPFNKNNAMWDGARQRAEAAGIMVLDCTGDRGIIGACWLDAEHPDDVARCAPGYPSHAQPRGDSPGRILAPASPRTVAQHYDYQGRSSYIYWGEGGLSWAIPYCAGVLAMGWQLRPDLSAEQMRDLLFGSAFAKDNGARIINPAEFIRLVGAADKTAPPSKPPGTNAPEESTEITATPTSTPADIASLIARIDIGAATLQEVERIFGKAQGTIGQSTVYPGGLQFYAPAGVVKEIRFESPESPYVFRGKIRVGSPLEEVLNVLGPPTDTVEGRNEWQDGVLYKNIDGKEGYCYLARPDQGVRFFFVDNRVSALYLTGAQRAESRLAPAKGQGRIRGRVVSQDTRRPLEYVAISFFKDNQRVRSEAFYKKSTFDFPLEPGTYEMYYASTLAPAGTRVLHADHGELVGADMVFFQEVTLAAGEEKELNLSLPEPWTASIRVVDQNGKPVSGAAVGPWYLQASGQPFRYGGHTTDAEGRFAFAEFVPGVKSGFNNDCADGYTQMVDEGVAGESGQVFPEKTLVVQKLQGKVNGQLVGLAGEPVPNQNFFVRSFFEDGLQAVQLLDTSAEGSFDWVVARPGQRFHLEISNNGGLKEGAWKTGTLILTDPSQVLDLGQLR